MYLRVLLLAARAAVFRCHSETHFCRLYTAARDDFFAGLSKITFASKTTFAFVFYFHIAVNNSSSLINLEHFVELSVLEALLLRIIDDILLNAY